MPDKLEGLTEEQSILLSDRSSIEKLLSSDGWKIIDAFITSNIRVARQRDFDNEVSSLDAAFRLAQDRGFLSGMVTAQKIPSRMVDDFDLELDILATKIEQEQADAARN